MARRPRSPKDAASFVDDALAPWKADLIVNANGAPAALLANAITALSQAPEWASTLAYDAFHQQVALRGRAPWMTDPADESWTGTHDLLTADWLQHHGIRVSPDIAGQAVEVVASAHRFHPVLDYLERCQWDGTARLDSWATEYLGAPDTPYVRAVSSKWMIGAVARVHRPGCKVDTALILEGPQGLGKSTALRVLGNPWFTDEVADLGTKDAALQLAGVWVLELAELDSMSRGEVSRIKAFMSRSTDRYRPPYARRPIEQPRQCAFGGTVNHTEYLRDETGGRRFWPITCAKVDIEGLIEVRDQLWAEARARYLADETWWLDDHKLSEAAAVQQSGRYMADVWQPAIEEWIRTKDHVTITDVLKGALYMDEIAKWTQVDMNRISRCLRALGWTRKQVRDKENNEKREWRYYPPDAKPEAAPSPVSPARAA